MELSGNSSIDLWNLVEFHQSIGGISGTSSIDLGNLGGNYVVFGEESSVSGGKWGEKEAGPAWKSTDSDQQ